MSLADELLADFGSDEENVVDQEDARMEDVSEGSTLHGNLKVDLSDLMNQGQDVTSDDLLARLDLKGVEIKTISKLLTVLKPILERIRTVKDEKLNPEIISNISDNAVYQLLVEANSYSVEIDNEIVVIHKLIKEYYAKRFDELGTLVLNPIDYAKTVRLIGNDLTTIASKDLKSILPKATEMVITMSAFENRGSPLSDYELSQVNHACDLLLALDQAKREITEFVSSKLAIFAPNVTQIVNSHSAAQIMGFCGGLLGLARIPCANIPALGAKRQVGIGFGHVGVRQKGFLYDSDIIQAVPAHKKMNAMKVVSGKLTLAARVDLAHGSRDGSQGKKWRDQINERIEKMLEPPENKAPKALPVPIDKPSKKRGGKRIRKFKEQFKPTELQRAQNRMEFGKEEEEVDAYGESVGLGMAGLQGNTGAVRQFQVDSKTRAKMSKGMQARLGAVGGLASVVPRKSGVSTQENGLASSLAFTAVQGIELVDPGRAQRQQKEEDRWLKNGTFTMIKKLSPTPGEITLGSSSVMGPPKRKVESQHEEPAKKQKTDG